jgi:predicted metal-dependent peptidase
MTGLPPERKLKKAKIDVMRSDLPGLRLWSGVMSIGKTSLCDKTATAYTNGRDEVYGTAFVDQLSVRELSFVCLHEAMHKGLRHLTTWRAMFKENPQLTNMACDYVVNRMIVAADPSETVCKFPRNPDGTRMGLYDEKYNGMSAKQVYDLLKKEQQSSGASDSTHNFDEHGWEDAQSMDKDEREALEKEIDHALRRGEAEAKRCGDGKGNLPVEIGALLRPAVDWRQALREFITSTCAAKDESTWRRPNRRFLSQGIYLPSTYGTTLGHAVVGADLSGSMWYGDPSPMQRIFTEVEQIARTVNPDKLDVLYWDTHVAGHDKFTKGQYEGILNQMRPKGGGGTSAACVPAYMHEHKIKPDCIIQITDGEVFGSWGTDYPAPVLWLIINNPKAQPPSGKVLHVTL